MNGFEEMSCQRKVIVQGTRYVNLKKQAKFIPFTKNMKLWSSSKILKQHLARFPTPLSVQAMLGKLVRNNIMRMHSSSYENESKQPCRVRFRLSVSQPSKLKQSFLTFYVIDEILILIWAPEVGSWCKYFFLLQKCLAK